MLPGKEWAKRGHEIVFGVRNIQSPKVKSLLKIADSNIKAATISEAASFGQVVLLAVPWEVLKETMENAGDLSGRILIDPINPLSSDLKDLIVGPSTSAAEEIAKLAQGQLVKAFNAIGAKTLGNLKFGQSKADTLFVVMALVQNRLYDNWLWKWVLMFWMSGLFLTQDC